MRILIVLALVGSLALPASGVAQGSPRNTSREAAEYLEVALDSIQALTLGRDTIGWSAVRDSAYLLAWGARTAAETYGAIAWALQRVNRHSFLQAPQPGVIAELVDGRFGYLRVPQRGGAAVPLADSLHGAVGRLGRQGACGWIVDLRGNGGGNMWPMLAGVGPLLGDSVVGSFGVGDDADRWFYRLGVSGVLTSGGRLDTITTVTVEPVPTLSVGTPVGILVDGGTGSSGEALAVAFHGRPNSRTFGVETAGFATVNRGSRLPDGRNMVVTTGYYADRLGREFSHSLAPDTAVDVGYEGWPFPTDRASSSVADWLSRQQPCR